MTSLQNDGWKNRQEDIDDERKAQGITSLQKESGWENDIELTSNHKE